MRNWGFSIIACLMKLEIIGSVHWWMNSGHWPKSWSLSLFSSAIQQLAQSMWKPRCSLLQQSDNSCDAKHLVPGSSSASRGGDCSWLSFSLKPFSLVPSQQALLKNLSHVQESCTRSWREGSSGVTAYYCVTLLSQFRPRYPLYF